MKAVNVLAAGCRAMGDVVTVWVALEWKMWEDRQEAGL